MTGLITQPDQLKFADGALLNGLANYLRRGGVGYWQHHFDRLVEKRKDFSWYLGVANGKLLYSGSSQLSASGLLRLILRYISPAQRDASKVKWKELQSRAQQNLISASDLLIYIQQEKLATTEQLKQAIQLKVFNDLDNYISLGSGWSDFIAVSNLAEQIPLIACDIDEFLVKAVQRRQAWQKIEKDIPALTMIPFLCENAWENTNFSSVQRAKVENLVKNPVNLLQIAQNMAKDNLEIAQTFAKLVRSGVVELHSPRSSLPTILMIDDSAIILNQFERWLTHLNYHYVPCQHAAQAIKFIEQWEPVVIFLDINMPVISGFELVKKIRSRLEFAHIPIVILTSEQKLSNKWRAQWSGCEFLTKPVSANEYRGFEGVLKELIPKLIASSPVVVVPS